MPSSIRFSWQDRDPVRGFRTGVSLHSHTMHSREGLGFIPGWASKVPLLCWEFKRLRRRFERSKGRPPDFSTAYWTPPLTALEALEVERAQIEDTLGLQAIVSLTDHDTIDAADRCRAAGQHVPVGVEWTVPFGDTFFHLGVHNIPVDRAPAWMMALARYTGRPEPGLLHSLLSSLDSNEGILIVLNHPMWDQAEIGAAKHGAALEQFMKLTGRRIHALEFNGLRSVEENQRVFDFALGRSCPVVSGGDRHCREPNAVINVSNALTFGDFVAEVRSGHSDVLVLPQYREPLRLRILQALMEVMEDSPGPTERGRWLDRVFYVRKDGQCAPLSSIWKDGGPSIVRCFSRGMQLARSRPGQRIIRPWLRRSQHHVVFQTGPVL